MAVASIQGSAPASGGAERVLSQSIGVSRDSVIAQGVDQIQKRTNDSIQTAAKTIESFVKDMGRSLDFQYDESSGKQIVRVSNPTTGEIVRQIPAEEVVQIARSLNYLENVLVSIKA